MTDAERISKLVREDVKKIFQGMTHEEKIEYMRLAASLCSFHLMPKDCDLLVSLYELILQKQGETNMKDALTIQHEVNQRYELLDKVSVEV